MQSEGDVREMASQSVTELGEGRPNLVFSTARKTILFCFNFSSSSNRYSLSELHKVFPPLFTLCLPLDPNSLMYFPGSPPPLYLPKYKTYISSVLSLYL